MQDENGYTALMAASSQGHTDIVNALLEKGADSVGSLVEIIGKIHLMIDSIISRDPFLTPTAVMQTDNKNYVLEFEDRYQNTPSSWSGTYIVKGKLSGRSMKVVNPSDFRSKVNAEILLVLSIKEKKGIGKNSLTSKKVNSPEPRKKLTKQVVDKKTLEHLIDTMKNKDTRIGWDAANKLAEIKDRELLTTMMPLLKDDRPYVRQRAANVLGAIGNSLAIEPLIELLNKDRDFIVQMQCAGALKKITGKDFGEDSIKWQNWWKENKATYIKGR